MITHYRILKEVLIYEDNVDQEQVASQCLDAGGEAILKAEISHTLAEYIMSGPYAKEKKEYLDLILRLDTRGAVRYVEKRVAEGMSIRRSSHALIQRVMYEIGKLWHRNEITVDKEHYATVVSQMVLSVYYDRIFGQIRNGKTFLYCCEGSELHEMGARMVFDLFECHGWDSVYLRAAVPLYLLIPAIDEHQTDLLALSVTMIPHLAQCNEMVDEARGYNPDLKIALGRRAFSSSQELWRKTKADMYGKTALELVRWAKENIIRKGG